MAAIRIDSEFGKLREVIVGLGIARIPDFERVDWGQTALKVLPESEAEVMRKNAGKHFRDLGKYEALEKENGELIAILEKFGVKVHRPTEVTDELVTLTFGREWLLSGYTQAFSRDPLFVVGGCVIELAPGAPFRRCDLLGYRGIFHERLPGSGARWFQMPGADVAAMGRPGYSKEMGLALEGGDCMVLSSSRVLVGNSLNTAVGSSILGIEWLRGMLGPEGYTVDQVRLREDFLHLDCCLSIPRQGLAVVCKEAFVDGLPSALEGWDLVEVSVEAARLLACNGLPIDPDNFIIGYNDQEDGSALKAALEGRGITVHMVYFASHNEDGGGVRCATHGLFRESA